MEFFGKIAKIMPERSGVSKTTGKPWKALPFVFEYKESENDRYPDHVLLETIEPDIIERLKEGDRVCIGFGHRTRVFNDRMYNELPVYKIEFLGESAPQSAREAITTGQPPVVPPETNNAPQSAEKESEDELPF